MHRFALLSAGLHIALLAGLVFWFHETPLVPDNPDREGAVELVMLEQQGTAPAAPPEPAPEVPAPPPTEAATPAPEVPTPSQMEAATPAPEVPTPPSTETRPPAPPTEAEIAEAEEPLPVPPPPPAPPAPPKPKAPSPPQPAAPPIRRAQDGPLINLPGNESETNAEVEGPHVIPASMDAKFHNREPVYPAEAVRRAEQGAVILMIHVSPDGLPNGVDIFRSSGFVLLDRAAREAVASWHFLPAVKDGAPIPFDMTLRVVFRLE